MVWNVPRIEIWEEEDLLYAFGLVAAVTEYIGDARPLEPLSDWFAQSHDKAVRWIETEWLYSGCDLRKTLQSGVLGDKWIRTAIKLRLVFPSEGQLGKLLALVG